MQGAVSLITIHLDGVGEASKSVLAVVSTIGIHESIRSVARTFEDRLRAATPVGYSGDLPMSVVSVADDDRVVVGYEKGVQDSGRKDADSVLRPVRKGRSVLYSQQSRRKRWITAGELETIMDETAEAYSAEVVDAVFSGLTNVGVT